MNTMESRNQAGVLPLQNATLQRFLWIQGITDVQQPQIAHSCPLRNADGQPLEAPREVQAGESAATMTQ